MQSINAERFQTKEHWLMAPSLTAIGEQLKAVDSHSALPIMRRRNAPVRYRRGKRHIQTGPS